MKRSICVVGGGVVGLTCAHVLSQRYQVNLVAERFGLSTNSRVATAIWHVYLVNNQDHGTLAWAQQTLEKLLELRDTEPQAGISLVKGVEVFRKSAEHDPTWAHIPPLFQLLSAEELAEFTKLDPPSNAALPIRWGYRIEAPAATMRRYLPWLLDQVIATDAQFNERRIESLQEAEDFGDLVVNCTGYAARDLVPGSGIRPVRGQYLIYPTTDGAPTEYFGDDDHPVETAYMVPRGGEIIVGGTEEYDVADLDGTVSPFRTEAELIERVAPFFPWVRSLVGVEPVQVVGVRPYRDDGVFLRVQVEPGRKPVIHNFGHGGSGFSLSWGCANQVMKLADEYFAATGTRV